MDQQRDIDILSFPLEGVAAYWLSLKKLVDEKRNFKVLKEEAEYTPEPYIKHLLETVFSGLKEEKARKLSGIKSRTILGSLARKYNLMRIALMDVAASVNPRVTLAKMTAQYPMTPMSEKEAFRLAQELMDVVKDKQADRSVYFNVDHRLKDDKLMVTLLFYVLLARHDGKMGCQPFLKYIASPFFADGLALVIDGFDAPFIRKRLIAHRDAIFAEAETKMEMSMEMCLGIADKQSYDEVFRIARAYMA